MPKRKYILITFTLLLVLLTLFAFATNYALLIGVSQFTDKGISPLKYTLNDVDGMYSTLVNMGLVKASNVTILKNPTYAQAISTILNIQNTLNKDDTLYFFYSGHGVTYKGQAYFLVSDTQLDAIKYTAIPQSMIDTLLKSKASRIIVLLDACHSGKVGDTKGVTLNLSKVIEQSAQSVVKGQGKVLITSSSGEQVSQEDNSTKMGVFTSYLVKALKNVKSYETLSNIFSEVKKEVSTYTHNTQTPEAFGDTKGIVIMKIPPKDEVEEIMKELRQDFANGIFPLEYADMFQEAINVLTKIEKGESITEKGYRIYELLKECYIEHKFDISVYPQMRKTLDQENTQNATQTTTSTNTQASNKNENKKKTNENETGIIALQGNDLAIGAKIYIDGKAYGKLTSAGTYIQLPLGKHEIKIDSDEINTWKKEITISYENELVKVEVNAEVATGKANILTTPMGAEIYVNGEDVGQAPYTLEGPVNKEYEIKVEKYGYKEFDILVKLKKGITQSFTYTLKKSKTYALTIDNPLNADIYINGNYVGNKSTLSINIPEGTCKISAKKNGYEGFEKEISVPQIANVEIFLQKKSLPSNHSKEKSQSFKKSAFWITGGYYPQLFVDMTNIGNVSLHIGLGYRHFLSENTFVEYSVGDDHWKDLWGNSWYDCMGIYAGIGYGNDDDGISGGLALWKNSGFDVAFHVYWTMFKIGNFGIGPNVTVSFSNLSECGTLYIGYVGFTSEF